MKQALLVIGLVLAVMVIAAPAMAALDVIDPATFAIDTTDVEDAGKVIVVGLAGLWGFRKVVKSINRS